MYALQSQAEALLENKFGVTPVGEPQQRLPQVTRELAARYLSGEFGKEMRESDFTLEEQAQQLPPNLKYAAAIELIARHAPLRILPGERLAGAATLKEASYHATPVLREGSTSHTTIGFEKLLRVGCRGLRAEIEARLAAGNLDASQEEYLQSMRICLDAAGIWHQRYMDALEQEIAATSDEGERRNYQEVLESLRRVPEEPPTNYREAVQSLWFGWSFQRLAGNWSSIGRIDKMLGSFLQHDLEAGAITLDDARDLLAHFWLKGCEWVFGAATSPGSGDAQFYQNVILAGVDEQDNYITNDVTYLVLDIVEELHISDYPIAVRVSDRTPERLWRRIAEVQRCGSGIVSIYNDDLVVRALTRFGYSPEDARNFTNDGCWETLIPGQTAFGYAPFDMLGVIQDILKIRTDEPVPEFATFDDLLAAFSAGVKQIVEGVYNWDLGAFNGHPPAPLLSLLVDDCIQNARDYYQGGPRYSAMAPHAGGLPDATNSLYVIDQLVFKEKRLSLAELVQILRGNWEGHEELRAEIERKYTLYGNGAADVDALAQRIFDDFVTIVEGYRKGNVVLHPAGISTFGREIGWRGERAATAFGRHAHDILAGNLEPTPGTDKSGPTAVVRSYCSFNFERLPNGVPLTMRMSPSSVAGENGLNALVALLKTFVKLGGWYLQLDVIDAATLRQAQKNPELYPNLTVRISGWSARFATLTEEWQEMVIQRTEQVM